MDTECDVDRSAGRGFNLSALYALLPFVLTEPPRVDCCLRLQNDGSDAHLMASIFAGTGSFDGFNLQALAVLMASICRRRQF